MGLLDKVTEEDTLEEEVTRESLVPGSVSQVCVAEEDQGQSYLCFVGVGPGGFLVPVWAPGFDLTWAFKMQSLSFCVIHPTSPQPWPTSSKGNHLPALVCALVQGTLSLQSPGGNERADLPVSRVRSSALLTRENKPSTCELEGTPTLLPNIHILKRTTERRNRIKGGK